MVNRGLRWSVNEAEVIDCNTFQTDEGEPKAYVKLAYFGGLTTIMVDPADAAKFRPFQGQLVSCSGGLFVEIKKSGRVSVTFSIVDLKPVK